LGDVLDINGEPVFDVRELPDDGEGIKVVQEVCTESFLRGTVS
jgi:hypothetical protein